MKRNDYKWFLAGFLLLIVSWYPTPDFNKVVSDKKVPHPFYISVTEINHNDKEKTLEISCKMFADDLEKIINKNYKTQLDISLVKDKARFDQLIPDYIIHHLGIAADGKVSRLTFIGWEKEKESVYGYFQAEHITSPKKMDITNNILHDFNETQINIIHVSVNGKRQSTKLDFPAKEASFTF